MSERVKLFTKILIAELEDLEDDFESWKRNLSEKHDTEKITEYVFLQNNVVIRQELANVRVILESILHDPPVQFVTLEMVRDHFLAILRSESDEYQFSGAVQDFARRKIEKVYAYLKE